MKGGEQHFASFYEYAMNSFSKLTNVVFILLVVVALLRVAARYLPISVLWAGELATNILVVIVFWGAAVAEWEDEHIRVNFFMKRLKRVIGDKYDAFVYLFILLFAVIVTIAAVEQAAQSWDVGGIRITWFRVGYLYGLMALGMAVIMLINAIRIVVYWRQ